MASEDADPWPPGGGEFVPRTPDGEPLVNGRRMTRRDARSWLKREDVLLGRWPCGPAVEWIADAGDRSCFAAESRQGEGSDCNPAGDVLLHRLPSGRTAVVLEESW